MLLFNCRSLVRVFALTVLSEFSKGAAVSSILPPQNATSNLRVTSLSNLTSSQPLSNRNRSAIYRPLFAQHRNDTPRFINTTQQNVNPLVPAAVGLTNFGHRDVSTLPEGACAPGSPCVNGACCSKVSSNSVWLQKLHCWYWAGRMVRLRSRFLWIWLLYFVSDGVTF